jgi:hypothetical protein
MRFLPAAALALALTAPGLVAAQETSAASPSISLDAKPMTWHGAQMSPEQVFEGEFTTSFDTSTFRADAAAPADTVWLAGWEDRPGDAAALPRRYHLRFVGRQTVEPSKYGSLGAYKYEVLITHLISARVLIGASSATPPVRRP